MNETVEAELRLRYGAVGYGIIVHDAVIRCRYQGRERGKGKGP